MPASARLVVVGRVTGVFGVRGWVHLRSDTQPGANILAYRPWYLGSAQGWRETEPLAAKRHGKGLVVQLRGCEDRDRAAALVGSDIAVERGCLPPLGEGEYYWVDLVGCTVRTGDGRSLGLVERMMETGANDVLVVRGDAERLIPFLPGRVVKRVDLEARVIEVDWDADF